jgi:hypothetical protein
MTRGPSLTGLSAGFGSLVDAVGRVRRFIERAMHGYDAEVDPEKRMAFRISINVGDRMVEGSHFYGNGIALPHAKCSSRYAEGQFAAWVSCWQVSPLANNSASLSPAPRRSALVRSAPLSLA